MIRALHWFRSDLRLRDNTALAEAARRGDELVALFVFDTRLLRGSRTGAPRVRFMIDCLERLGADLAARGVPLLVRRGDPTKIVPAVVREVGADLVCWNRDVSPFARRRDARVREAVEGRGVEVLDYKDRVVFEAAEVRTKTGGPYAVYSPYRRAWYQRLADEPHPPRRMPALPPAPARIAAEPVPTAADLGFAKDEARIPTGGEEAALRRLRSFLDKTVATYPSDRDVPSLDGTSRLSPYLRFGVLSPRQCIAAAREAAAADRRLAKGVEKWVDELVWREFYSAILEENPRVLRKSYRTEYEELVWNDDPAGFAAWCEGRTGFPIVDAGMRQLLETGWMHNRVRMITASFLTKDLLIDWRLGERWFYERLVDGDPASNNGGWQWASSTGTDAQPYFRIFNPTSQGERHDPDGTYVRRWIPELADVPDKWIHRPWEAPLLSGDYPSPIVDHAERRELALERFRAVKEKR
ncbi:MAG: deoxyribodipyrimidine photo-lyase [Myxococcota bacterium]|nr:deoxyribodipyrimidine photo-lyase [Myxococcota bacterium]